MGTQKPKSIKNVGLIVAILSGLVVFSNGMSLLMFTLLGFNNYDPPVASEHISIDYLFNNLHYFLFLLVVFGILFFVSSIQLMKYKKWAKKCLSWSSVVLIIFLSILLILGIYTSFIENELVLLLIPISLIWLVFTVPLFFFIRFLNKKNIQSHFN